MSAPEPQSDDHNVICPHCLHAYQAEAEDYSTDETDEECEKCGGHFILSTEFYITHYTKPNYRKITK